MKTASSVYITNQKTADNTSGASQPNVLQASSSEPVVSEWVTLDKEFTAKEKLEIVLSALVQGDAGGRGVWGEFRPPSPVSSVRIFSNRHRSEDQRPDG